MQHLELSFRIDKRVSVVVFEGTVSSVLSWCENFLSLQHLEHQSKVLRGVWENVTATVIVYLSDLVEVLKCVMYLFSDCELLSTL